MSIIAPFLKNIITTISSTTQDAYNDNTLTTVYSNVPCRWEEVMKEEENSRGMTKEFGIRCWLLPDYVIKSGYIFTFEEQNYEVVGQEKYRGVFGEHDHTCVYLGYLR